ncbi:unnamed protein product [Pleuronectes platessa]|uniref:Uncharacterized protein n=1 Tax=Pleuronectes platessa TaxID=8262 RepID=A0A9N7YC79_PLEPL|nr:unnamed protein product [Pleuronectes platessa]
MLLNVLLSQKCLGRWTPFEASRLEAEEVVLLTLVRCQRNQTTQCSHQRKVCLTDLHLPMFGSENQQLEWAKQESQREEQDRLRRLRLQEQQDLELAIALSRADMPSA